MTAEQDQLIPIISRVSADGSIIETIYDPETRQTAFAVALPGGKPAIASEVTDLNGDRFIPYSGKNNLIASGCVLLPGDVGEFGDKGDLLQSVQAFIHRYVDLSPLYEEIATHYVLLTWVHDAFNELPYLRFRGDFGTGKTRALLAVGSVCYKPFFASAASTVSPIFHILDAVGGTLVLDEADFRFSDATAELTKILNNGNVVGLPVLRTMTNRHRELHPQAFRVFGPKIVGMRERFGDAALESRFLTEETGQRPLRPDVPIHLPEQLRAEARELRNRLLAWRFAARNSLGPLPDRLIPGVSPRLNQTALALLSIVDDACSRERIARELGAEEVRSRQERALSPDAAVLQAVCEEARANPMSSISLAAIAARFSENNQEAFDVPLSPRSIGYIVRTKLRLATMKSHGVYVIPTVERAKLPALAARYGIAFDQRARE